MKKQYFLIILILIIAAFLRFYNLDNFPALNADEAAIGYNAYSLILTGKDEHGNFWPVHFQSFNDYKPGLYFYIVMPFIKILGLNELAVRIPGAFLGVMTVFLVWILVRELFPKRASFPEIAALFLAVSPWHIHFSRGGWEVNVATFFITLGVVGFLKGFKKVPWMIVSGLSFVASLYTYHAARIVVPLLLLGMAVIYRKQLWRIKKQIIIITVLLLLLLIPLAKDFFGPAGSARLSGVSIFADQGVVERINEQRGEHGELKTKFGILLHNKPVNYSITFIKNWTSHFSGEFLFLSGDEVERNKIPETGLLYLFDLPLILIGFFAISSNPKEWAPILWWLLVAPAAAAFTFQSPHALRAHSMVIPWVLISAFGCLTVIERAKDHISFKHFRITFYALLVFIFTWNVSRYLHEYYVHMAKEYPYSSQYGVKDLVSYVKDNYSSNEKFVITDAYDQPYILFLFYLHYPPDKFQKEHVLTSRDKFGFSTVRDFDKFHFEQIGNWDQIIQRFSGAIIVGTDKEISGVHNIVHTIYFPSGDVAFRIVKN